MRRDATENDAFPGWTNQPWSEDMGEQSSIEWDKRVENRDPTTEEYEGFNHWEEQQLINSDVPSEGTIDNTYTQEEIISKVMFDSWDNTTKERIKEAFDTLIGDVLTKIGTLNPGESFTIDSLSSFICQNDGETILILGCLSDETKDIDNFWFPMGTVQKDELLVYYAAQQ